MLPRWCWIAAAAVFAVAGMVQAQIAPEEKLVARTWSARDSGGGPINLEVVQHPKTGFIYAGNGRGVLEYDGVRWRLIALPARGPARTVAIDSNGEIWAGSYNEIAVLRPDAAGEFQAESVLARVATPERQIEFVSQALATPLGMCMVEQGHIFLFHPGGETQVWTCPVPPVRVWWMEGAIYAVLTGRGIVRLERGGELHPVPVNGAPLEPFDPKTLRVLAARTIAEGRTILLTSRGPVEWMGGTRTLRPIAALAQRFAKEEVTAAEFLSGGRFMCATEAGNFLVFDLTGKELVNGAALAAFSSGRVTDLFEDAEGGIWVAKTVGLARLQFGAGSRAAPPTALVRRVVTAMDRVVVGGAKPAPVGSLALTPDHTTLRFELAAPSYRLSESGRSQLMFRTKLDGMESAWSEWTADAQREFLNLPLRAYTLRVQARDGVGREGPETTLAFSLAQHWWLTPWAYIGYAGGAMAVFGGAFKLLTRAHRRRAEQLEAIVATRTEDLRRSNAELARLREIDRDEKIAARLAEEKARLEVLRYQLNPHFLYNTLNSLYSLVLTSPPAAADMVLRLADFCRVALERNDEQSTSVGTCFDRMGLYLEIEKVRWGAGLQVEVATDAASRSEQIPPFLVLPLLENAIKYGGATSPEMLRLRLTARMVAPAEGGAPVLEIEVANTGHWVAPADALPAASTGIGLENLRQRLQRYFPGRHKFTVEVRDGWVRVVLHLQTSVDKLRTTVRAEESLPAPAVEIRR